MRQWYALWVNTFFTTSYPQYSEGNYINLLYFLSFEFAWSLSPNGEDSLHKHKQTTAIDPGMATCLVDRIPGHMGHARLVPASRFALGASVTQQAAWDCTWIHHYVPLDPLYRSPPLVPSMVGSRSLAVSPCQNRTALNIGQIWE